MDDTNHPTPARGDLLVAGACLTAGLACAVAAVLQPGVSSEWRIRSALGVFHLADGGEDAWQLANQMFAVGAWLTLAGVAALAVPLARRSARPYLPVLALTLLTGAVTLWTVNLTFTRAAMRAVAVPRARDVPPWYEYQSDWASEGFLGATALLAGAALVRAVRRQRGAQASRAPVSSAQ